VRAFWQCLPVTSPREHAHEGPREEKWGREVHRIGQPSHHQGTQNMAAIRRGPQPADRDALQRWSHSIPDERRREAGHEARCPADRQALEAQPEGSRHEWEAP
jgi:hypothetical protein